jgi:hypothetical protein
MLLLQGHHQKACGLPVNFSAPDFLMTSSSFLSTSMFFLYYQLAKEIGDISTAPGSLKAFFVQEEACYSFIPKKGLEDS